MRPKPSPEGKTWLTRLSFLSYNLDHDPAAVLETVSRLDESVLLFCDTSFFDEQTDPRLLEVILSGGAQLALVPSVLDELEPRLQRHPSNLAARPILQRDSRIRFVNCSAYTPGERAAFAYYANLLRVRKNGFRLQEIKYESEHGRPPGEDEREEVRRSTECMLGTRGYILARKTRDRRRPESQADEELVYIACSTAIAEGRETIILTKDQDLQEHFYKLLWLMDTHYRGMLFAKAYADDPVRFHTEPLPSDVDGAAVCLEGDATLIHRTARDIRRVLPARFTFVPIHCWVLGQSLDAWVYGAEREMASLLQVKGSTGGLNTDLLDGRNCHIWAAPLGLPMRLRGTALLCTDRRVRLKLTPNVGIPMLDYHHALLPIEQFTSVRYSDLAP